MKRKALLIGNSNGLFGVQKDLLDFQKFLLSNQGGAWYRSEIIIIEKSDLKTVRDAINGIKKESPDYVITLFSGHGGYNRETILELSDGKLINESELFGLAPKQLSIFDCCRVSNTVALSDNFSMDSYDLSESSKESARKIYEGRIQQAINQQAYLYSCAINESAYDTSQGGIYLQNLLSSARNFDQYIEENKVSTCHQKAKYIVERSNITSGKQHPEAILPRCLSSQELILSINY